MWTFIHVPYGAYTLHTHSGTNNSNEMAMKSNLFPKLFYFSYLFGFACDVSFVVPGYVSSMHCFSLSAKTIATEIYSSKETIRTKIIFVALVLCVCVCVHLQQKQKKTIAKICIQSFMCVAHACTTILERSKKIG